MQQLITPNPDIPDRPGYCLEYVRQTFNLSIRYGSAIEAWQNSTSQHPDYNFPEGCWVPVWFTIDTVPEGHVALKAPDGTVYSDSDLNGWPHHHPSINDLIAYYAYWGGMTLTYLGWTEDVAGYPVVGSDITVQSIPTTEDDMPTLEEIKQLLLNDSEIHEAFAIHLLHRDCELRDPSGNTDAVTGTTTLAKKVNWMAHNDAQLLNGIQELHTVVNKLLPDPAHSDATPVVPVQTIPTGVNP